MQLAATTSSTIPVVGWTHTVGHLSNAVRVLDGGEPQPVVVPKASPDDALGQAMWAMQLSRRIGELSDSVPTPGPAPITDDALAAASGHSGSAAEQLRELATPGEYEYRTSAALDLVRQGQELLARATTASQPADRPALVAQARQNFVKAAGTYGAEGG